ncbi:root hair defective 3 GTP-binding protein, partial [Aureobasidium melanogenum]
SSRTNPFSDEQAEPILLPEYHRRIPADGFSMYAGNIWEQIDSNKDLDLPTQQELLAQFRCDEIAREVLVAFDEVITPLESKQADAAKSGSPSVLSGLGKAMNGARARVLKDFTSEASRYHQGVYKRKSAELESNVDARLKTLFQGQLSAAHKTGVQQFTEAVSTAVKSGQKKGSNYDFQKIVNAEKQKALEKYEQEAS